MRRIFAVLLTVCMAFILCTSTSYAQETTEAQIVTEAFELTEISDGKLRFKVKLRNLSSEDRSLYFDYQLLDQNGDIIYSSACGTSTIVAPGQAIWAGPYGVNNEHIDEAVSIRFVSSKYFPKGEEIYLKEPATFPLFDTEEPENGVENSNKPKELVFRNVKFGTTYKDAMPVFAEGGLTNIFAIEDEDNAFLVYFADEVEVAGFKMKVILQFRRPSEDNSNIDDSIFMKAIYIYEEKITQGDATKIYISYYYDLLGKLEDLYGNDNKKTRDSTDTELTTTHTWKSFDLGGRLEYQVSAAMEGSRDEIDVIVIMLVYSSQDEVRKWNDLEIAGKANVRLSDSTDGL